jgi:hypothetical protein
MLSHLESSVHALNLSLKEVEKPINPFAKFPITMTYFLKLVGMDLGKTEIDEALERDSDKLSASN